MAIGIKGARRIQFGLETTPGTGVAATARMRWNGGTLDDAREHEFPEELVGFYDGTDRQYTKLVSGALDIAETPLTPDQLPYLFAAGLGGPVTGAADGTGSTGFRYATTIPFNPASPPTNRAYTVEGGDNNEVERLTYGKVTKIVLKGSQKAACTMSGAMIGQQVALLGGGFAATTLVDTNDLIFAGSRLYLDAVGGTIGTTQVQEQLLGFEITIEPMWVPKQTGEGAPDNPIWSFVVYTGCKITGKLTLENGTSSTTGIVNGTNGIRSWFRARTPRLMRLDVLGQSYATAGTGTLLTGRRGVRLDLPIRFTKVPPLEDVDGNATVTVEFESRYNSTFGGRGTITVANETSALP